MSKHAFDFLTESPLWELARVSSSVQELSDDDAMTELARYRAHILSLPIEPSGSLSVALSARELVQPTNEIKRSILYFDEVLLPDPLFAITDITRERAMSHWGSHSLSRNELLSAVRYMQELTPMVRSGRVRFIPSTHVLEGPERLPLYWPKEAFSELVPDHLRSWFHERVRVRKVITDEQGQRLVLGRGPDSNTGSIMIDFGQCGRLSSYDYMTIEETGIPESTSEGSLLPVVLRTGVPADDAVMQRWIAQSVNKSCRDFLDSVVTDAQTAWNLGASFVTSCETTAELIAKVRGLPDEEASSALALDLPMVETASFLELEELLTEEHAAFSAFRFELRSVAESLASIEDAKERSAQAKRAAERLARDQIVEVERKMQEANRKLKWNIPITGVSLAAGAIGFAVSAGPHKLLAALPTLLQGAGAVMSLLRDQQGYRALPGYFLWRLKKNVSG